jgi:hypothetical protein
VFPYLCILGTVAAFIIGRRRDDGEASREADSTGSQDHDPASEGNDPASEGNDPSSGDHDPSTEKSSVST